MRKLLLALAVLLATGCASGPSGGGAPFGGLFSGGVSKTLEAPIARVKPAFLATVVQMGMSVSAVETRGRNEIIKARRAGKTVEIEFERMSANATRVRVSGADDATNNRIFSDSKKRIAAG